MPGSDGLKDVAAAADRCRSVIQMPGQRLVIDGNDRPQDTDNAKCEKSAAYFQLGAYSIS